MCQFKSGIAVHTDEQTVSTYVLSCPDSHKEIRMRLLGCQTPIELVSYAASLNRSKTMRFEELKKRVPHALRENWYRHTYSDGSSGGWIEKGAQIMDDVTIEHNAIIYSGATIGYGAYIGYSVEVGCYASIGLRAYINDGVIIGSYAHIGDCTIIGHDTEIGANIVISNMTSIGHDSTIRVALESEAEERIL